MLSLLYRFTIAISDSKLANNHYVYFIYIFFVIQRGRRPPSFRRCYKCNKPGHLANQCWAPRNISRRRFGSQSGPFQAPSRTIQQGAPQLGPQLVPPNAAFQGPPQLGPQLVPSNPFNLFEQFRLSQLFSGLTFND